MQKYLIILTLLVLGAFGAEARHYDRGYDALPASPFVSKGTWVVGGNVRYSQHTNDNHSIMVIDNINSEGFNLSANSKLMYMVRDNMGLGLRFSYDRSMLDLISADLSFSDISMSASDCYQIQHKFSGYAVYRAYIPLGNARRISMFADLLLGGSYKQGKAYNAAGPYALGYYVESYAAEIAVDPGIAVFLSDRLSLELNVGVFGLSYNWSDQLQNQVSAGHSDSTSAGFIVNLLSLGVGMSYYFL